MPEFDSNAEPEPRVEDYPPPTFGPLRSSEVPPAADHVRPRDCCPNLGLSVVLDRFAHHSDAHTSAVAGQHAFGHGNMGGDARTRRHALATAAESIQSRTISWAGIRRHLLIKAMGSLFTVAATLAISVVFEIPAVTDWTLARGRSIIETLDPDLSTFPGRFVAARIALTSPDPSERLYFGTMLTARSDAYTEELYEARQYAAASDGGLVAATLETAEMFAKDAPERSLLVRGLVNTDLVAGRLRQDVVAAAIAVRVTPDVVREVRGRISHGPARARLQWLRLLKSTGRATVDDVVTAISPAVVSGSLPNLRNAYSAARAAARETDRAHQLANVFVHAGGAPTRRETALTFGLTIERTPMLLNAYGVAISDREPRKSLALFREGLKASPSDPRIARNLRLMQARLFTPTINTSRFVFICH